MTLHATATTYTTYYVKLFYVNCFIVPNILPAILGPHIPAENLQVEGRGLESDTLQHKSVRLSRGFDFNMTEREFKGLSDIL